MCYVYDIYCNVEIWHNCLFHLSRVDCATDMAVAATVDAAMVFLCTDGVLTPSHLLPLLRKLATNPYQTLHTDQS